MNRYEKIPVIVVSAALLLVCILVNYFPESPLIGFFFFTGPLLMVWLVYNVVRHGKFRGKELEKDEEWGYADKRKEDLGVF